MDKETPEIPLNERKARLDQADVNVEKVLWGEADPEPTSETTAPTPKTEKARKAKAKLRFSMPSKRVLVITAICLLIVASMGALFLRSKPRRMPDVPPAPPTEKPGPVVTGKVYSHDYYLRLVNRVDRSREKLTRLRYDLDILKQRSEILKDFLKIIRTSRSNNELIQYYLSELSKDYFSYHGLPTDSLLSKEEKRRIMNTLYGRLGDGRMPGVAGPSGTLERLDASSAETLVKATEAKFKALQAQVLRMEKSIDWKERLVLFMYQKGYDLDG